MYRTACLTALLSVLSVPAALAQQNLLPPDSPALTHTPKPDLAQEARNKAAAIAFYKTQNAKDWEAAKKYLGDHWIEHNSDAPDGLAGLERYYKMLKTSLPQHQSIIRASYADGDIVVLHIQDVPQPGTRGFALIAFLRFENGKIVEHWDVHQEIPGVANYNGVF